ncbi:MAG: ABC transporter substrate-binding protein [Methylobacteriaceae bacterium]|nr:ABC transporter substrate-binding protein [Methylobacteriaceae bacterium]
MKKHMLLGAFAALAFTATAALAQVAGIEKPKLVIGVGGKSLLYYLPLTIAEKKGYFKEQGLDAEIIDFAGGAKSLQALIGGSVDIVAGAYEHTIHMQAKGQDIRATVDLGRYPGIVIALRKDVKYDKPSDLKGLKIGVTAPGSSTNMLAKFFLAKNGLSPDDASWIGVGGAASAVAAIRNKQVDGVSHLEPVITMLEQTGDIKIVADTRTEAGTRALFGGENPAAVIYTKKAFIDANPNTVQAIVNAEYKALQWLKTASAEDVASLVPENYLLGDRKLYMAAFQSSRASYSQTGLIDPAGMKSALDMLAQFTPDLKSAKIDLGATFDDRFAKKAAESVK